MVLRLEIVVQIIQIIPFGFAYHFELQFYLKLAI